LCGADKSEEVLASGQGREKDPLDVRRRWGGARSRVTREVEHAKEKIETKTGMESHSRIAYPQ